MTHILQWFVEQPHPPSPVLARASSTHAVYLVAYTKEFFRKRLTAQLRIPAGSNGHPTSADADALIRIPDDREFVSAVYRTYLGRDCDLSGMVHHLESLQNHVPRRVVLARVAESEEARRSGGAPAASAPAPQAPRDGIVSKIRRRVSVRVRDLARQLILARFDSIDYKLSFLLEEMAARTDNVAKKVDGSHAAVVTLATKSDDYFAETWRRQAEAETAIQELRENLRDVASRLHPPVIQAGNVLATEVHGFIVGVPAAEWRMAAYLSLRGPLEPGLTRLFERLVRPGMIVADVGANVGFYTLLAARLLAGVGKVYSFEPAPATFAILGDNIQVNGFLESGIIDHRQQAVSAVPGTARLFVFADNSGHNTLFWPDAGAAHVDVPAVSLDQVFAEAPKLDFVKIDAEGAEPAILAGMRKTIGANPGIRIVIEFGPGHLHRAGRPPAEFLAELGELGLSIQRIDEVTGDLHPASSAELLSCFSANLLLERQAGGSRA